MNPTSTGTRSPGYTPSPNISPSLLGQELENVTLPDQAEWNVPTSFIFPIYAQDDNVLFKQAFHHHVKNISLQLKTMMAYLSETSSETIDTPLQAFSHLVSCLGNNLPTQIPLSIFTSSVALSCIANIEHAPHAKKRKFSASSEESGLQKKLLETAQGLASAISSTLSFLKDGVDFNKLKEKNPGSHQSIHAFQHAISQRLAVECSVVLDSADQELANSVVSAIDIQSDRCSYEAKIQLLRNATSEFVKTQEALIADVYIFNAHTKNPLPITGKSLLTICQQASAGSTSVSANVEGLPSWENHISCYLARTFLQNIQVVLPLQTDLQSLISALKVYIPDCAALYSTTFSPKLQQSALGELVDSFSHFYGQQPDEARFQCIDVSASYNKFLQCSTSIASLLKGFFILETGTCISEQNLSNFQAYAQTLFLPNTTVAINIAIQEAASICAEEHQKILSPRRMILEETKTLLKQLMLQSLALLSASKKSYKNRNPQDIMPCEWMPDALRSSSLFCNVWREAIWEHESGMPLGEDLLAVSQELKRTLNATAEKLQKSFLQFCYALLMDILKEMPLDCPENILGCFFSKARVIQDKMIPKNEQTSELFTIGVTFITQSERVTLRNTLLKHATQNFEEAQKAFVAYTYNFILQQEIQIPSTEEALLSYCKNQYQGNIKIPAHLEKLPFWKDYIFLYLVHVFLQKKHRIITVFDEVKEGIKAVKRCFTGKISSTMSISSQRDALTKAIVEMLFLFKQAPISAAEQTKIATNIYADTAYENVGSSIASFNTLIQALFKLDTGKSLSPKNLRAFQKYMQELIYYAKSAGSSDMLLQSFSIYMDDPDFLDLPQQEIRDNLAEICTLLEKLAKEALIILLLKKQTIYPFFSPQIAVLTALRATCSHICIPSPLLLSEEMLLCWKKAIQCAPEENILSQIPNHLKHTSKLYNETASKLTPCFLKLCQNLFVEISSEILLCPETDRFLQDQKETFIQTASTIVPKMILEPYCRQSMLLKEIVQFLAEDKFSTGSIECLTLATENFLKAQKEFSCATYAHLIKHKLPLPLTGNDLLICCKKQFGSTTSVLGSLATLPSWDTTILYALAHVFLLSKGQEITSDFQPWNVEHLIIRLVPFFREQIKEITLFSTQVPIAVKTKAFTKHLVQHFSAYRSVETQDKEPDATETDTYLCKIYENFLKSSDLLKTFLRTLFRLDTGNDYSPQHLPEFQEYIAPILSNEPALRRTSALRDLAIICSENNESLEHKQIWQDLNHVNSLLNTLMEVSLALMLFCGTTDKELTPQQAVETALQITSSVTYLPLELEFLPKAFITSSAGTRALQYAMDAYVSGTLCLQLFKEPQLLFQGTAINPLQAAIDAHVSGQVSPQINAYQDALSSVFFSTKGALESICKKLHTNLKADVLPAIPKEPSLETPSQQFITTANNCHEKMMAEQPKEVPLFHSLVLLLAQEYERELQKSSAAASDQFMSTKDVLLEEDDQAIRDKASQPTTTQTTETEEILENLLRESAMEEALAKLFQEPEEGQLSEDFTNFLEGAGDFTDFLEEDFQFEEETEEETAS